MADIDIGAAAIGRAVYSTISSYTTVGKENPANAAGQITSCKIWLESKTGASDVWVGTFSASGNVLTCRDSESIGDITVGSEQTASGLDVTVETNDYWGCFDKSAETVRIERDSTGDGVWSYTGECIDPSDSQTFDSIADRTISLYGTGETAGAPQTISSAGAIASAEAFGSHQVNLHLALSAIVSTEAFGSHKINFKLEPSGIATAEVFGTAKFTLFILPSSIASVEAFGTAKLSSKLSPSAIASLEDFGTPVVAGPIIAESIASLEAFGTAQLNLTIYPSSIVSAETFGTAQLNLKLSVTGIVSVEAFGTPQLNLKITVSGITSSEAFGTAIVAGPIIASGIASAEAFGTAQLNLKITISGIVSSEAFGTPTLTLFILPSSIASVEAFGTPAIKTPIHVIVRIAFDTDPLAVTPTWTDIYADVLSIYTKRGRQHELGRMETGIATIQLKNTGGNYWPLNAAGDYFGKVLPGKKINVRASFNGVIYDLYTGFIEAWQPAWLDRKIAITTVRCVDIGKRFSRFELNNAGEAEELSGTRVGNVLDEIGWPAADRDLDAGQTTLKATGVQVAVNAMSHLFLVQDTEVGIIFLAPDGDIQYQDRHARFKAPYTVSQAVFGDDPGEEKYRYLRPSYDDQFIYNDIRRTRDGGTEQTASDATSQDDYGKSTSNKTGLLMLLDTEAKDQCDYMLSQYKDPTFRIKELEIYPEIDPDDLFPKALGYDISTRITLRLNEASLDREYHIEGIMQSFDKRRGGRPWTTKWQLSDADSLKYWAIGVAGFSEIGETTRLAY